MSEKNKRSFRRAKAAVALVYVTAKDTRQALRIARTVVLERLAACANILGPIQSIYRWNGALQQDREVVLLLKTRRTRVKKLAARIKALHSYEIPCVVALDLVDGYLPFLDWIQQQTTD